MSLAVHLDLPVLIKIIKLQTKSAKTIARCGFLLVNLPAKVQHNIYLKYHYHFDIPNNKLYLSRFMHYYNSVLNWNKKYVAPFNNHGQGNYTCLPSQFDIVKYWRSTRLLFKKGANFGYHLSSLSFRFLGFSLNLGPYLRFMLDLHVLHLCM